MAAIPISTQRDDAAFLNHTLNAMWGKPTPLPRPNGRPLPLRHSKPVDWVSVLPAGTWGALAAAHSHEKRNVPKHK